MPGFKVGAKVGVGSDGASAGGFAYPVNSSGGKAPDDVITGELLALVVIELMLLGAIRISFKHHFGG